MALLAPGAPANADPALSTVAIEAVAPEGIEAQLTQTLGELLARRGIRLHTRGEQSAAEAPASTFAKVQFVWAADGSCVLRVSDQEEKLVASRTVPSNASTLVTVDTAAHVVFAVVDELQTALRTRRRPLVSGAERHDTFDAAAPTSEVEVQAQESLRWSVVGLVSARAYSATSNIAFGPGVGADVRTSVGKFGVGGWLWLGYQVPFATETDEFRLQLQGITSRAGALMECLRWGRFRLDAQLGIGLDVQFSRLTVVPALPRRPPPGRTHVEPTITTFASAHWAAAERISIAVHLGVDVGIIDPKVEVDIGGIRTTVYDPWPVRPFVMVAFHYGVE